MSITTRVQNHMHRWSRNRKFTSLNEGHRHRLDLKKGIALPAGRGKHTHKLLGGI